MRRARCWMLYCLLLTTDAVPAFEDAVPDFEDEEDSLDIDFSGDASGATPSTVEIGDASGATPSTVEIGDASGATPSTVEIGDASGATPSTVEIGDASGATPSTVKIVTEFCESAQPLSQREQLEECAKQNSQNPVCAVLQVSFEFLNSSCKAKDSYGNSITEEIKLNQTANKITQALAEKNDSYMIDQSQTSGMLLAVESIAIVSFAAKPRTQQISTSQLDIAMTKAGDYCISNTASFTLTSGQNSMEVPCTLVPSNRDGAVFITYEDLASYLSLSLVDRAEDSIFNSKVVTGMITNPDRHSLNSSVIFRIAQEKSLLPFHKLVCVFWNPEENGWSDRGCTTKHSNATHTTCSCCHLSSFAVLMAPFGIEDHYGLTIISHIGLSVSLFCLCLSLLTFTLCRSLRNTHTPILTALCGCLFLGQIFILVGLRQTQNKVMCSITAGSLQYMFLCAFCWMSIESVLLFMMVQNLHSVNYMTSRRSKFPAMCLMGFGIPAVIVGISAAIHPQGYSTKTYCWLHRSIIWSFLGPACVLICVNTVFLVLTVWLLRKRLASLNTNVSTLKNTRLLTFKALAQAFILGCTWGIGFFQFGSFSLGISYIFTICNSLQGVYIFLVHCVLNQQVRGEYRKFFCRQSKQSLDVSTSGALQTTSKSTHVYSTSVPMITKKKCSEGKKVQLVSGC